MLLAQLFMLAIALLLVFVTYRGWINAWSLLALTFLIGCGVAFNNPAWQASVRDFVGKDLLPVAVLLNGVGFNVTRSVAPAIGGVIVAAGGALVAFVVNAVSYLGLIFAIWSWQGPAPRAEKYREPLRSAIVAGVRYVSLSPHLMRVYLRGLVFGLCAIIVLALLPLVARDLLQGDSLTFGILLGGFGLGAVVAGLSSEKIAARLSAEQMVRLAFLTLAVAVSTISHSPWFVLTLGASALSGWSWVLALALFNTTVQMSTPRWVVGRAVSFYQMFTFGGMAFGSWLWGAFAEAYSLADALQASAFVMLGGAIIGLRWALPSRQELDLDPADRWREPAVKLDIVPRSGPLSIAVEYVVEPHNVGEFVRLMRERQRIRRRDGARQWTLLRNLEETNQWIERFELPTWADYVRFHSRTTLEDAKVSDRIRALHSGPQPPRVRRMLVRDPGDGRIGPYA